MGILTGDLVKDFVADRMQNSKTPYTIGQRVLVVGLFIVLLVARQANADSFIVLVILLALLATSGWMLATWWQQRDE